MMRLISAVLFAAASFGSAGAEPLEPLEPLYLGMPRQEVLEVLGAPEYERLERNSVRCLAYRTRLNDPRFPKLLLPRDGLVVAIRSGRVVGTEEVLYSEISEGCSRLASAWDLLPRDDYTCLRKFWLRC